jgi:diguanylate cyclase (GGDEF)-like protein
MLQFGKLRVLVTSIGLIAAAVITLALPLAVGLVLTVSESRDLSLRAEIAAKRVAKYVYSSGQLWHYQRLRLEELLQSAEGMEPGFEMTLKSRAGEALVAIGAVAGRYRLTEIEPVTVSGTVVGTVETSVSLDPILVRVGWAAGLGAALGFAVYFAIRLLPLRVLDSVLADLERAQDAMVAKTIELENASHTASAATEQLRQQNNQLREAEVELRTQNYRFHLALDNMVQGLTMWDSDNRLIVASRVYRQMYQLPEALVRPGTSLRAILEHLLASGIVMPRDPLQFIEERAQRGDGHTPLITEMGDGRVISVTRSPMTNGGYVATHEDITERLRADAQIVHMAHHDALTNLPNRVLLRVEMEKALAKACGRGERFVLMMLDIDRFKSINDALGHPAGDALLREVSGRLSRTVRAGDTVARLGGDEFAILLVGGLGIPEAETMARRIIAAISEPCVVGGQSITVSTSIGIVTAPDDGTDLDHLFRNADIALYRAKGEGRGTFRSFDRSMDREVQARHTLELELGAAFAKDEFELHYQPQVDLATGEVTGFEALLRWRHPERGLISPAVFVPIAEEIGLIEPLGEWVIRKACQDARGWPDSVKVAVNLSPEQFHAAAKLRAIVVDALATSGLPARRLELEITESVLLADDAATLRTLHDLRALGLSVSLDDFGTGYSSLSYLRKFPFDKIKIDQSFVRELSTRSDCVAIVRAVAGLARTLGMTTVAEGVETQLQRRQLMAEGCTEAQGYLFSPPMPNAGVVALLKARRRYTDAA